MKITDYLGDLILELAETESFNEISDIVVHDNISVKNTLEMFHQVSNTRSKEILAEIIEQTGFGWLTNADNATEDIAMETAIPQSLSTKNSPHWQDLSEDEFMHLVPANGYIH